MPPLNDATAIAVLASGHGTNLQALIDAAADPGFGARIVAVGSDRDDAGALSRAAEAGISTFVERTGDYETREQWDAALASRLIAYEPDLVILAGFMKLAGPHFLAHFGGRTLNTHPALSPAFPGMRAPADALAYGVKITGATLFIVDEGVDTGPIIAQVAVPVHDDDSVESLHERIKASERHMLVDWVGRLARDGYRIDGRRIVTPPAASSPPPSTPSLDPEESA